MSDRPPSSKKRASAKSGQHPAVQAYRAKLESIESGASEAISKLDHEFDAFLSDLKTPKVPA